MDMEEKGHGWLGTEWPGPAHSECSPTGTIMGITSLTLMVRGHPDLVPLNLHLCNPDQPT